VEPQAFAESRGAIGELGAMSVSFRGVCCRASDGQAAVSYSMIPIVSNVIEDEMDKEAKSRCRSAAQEAMSTYGGGNVPACFI